MDSFTQPDPIKTKILQGSQISTDKYGALGNNYDQDNVKKKIYENWAKGLHAKKCISLEEN